MKTLSNPYLATLLLGMCAKAAGADRLIDPTRPADAPTQVRAVENGVRVEAILRSAERDLAIVNGKVVHAGDRLGAVHVQEILADGIRYTRDGRSYVARIQHRKAQVRRASAQPEDPT